MKKKKLLWRRSRSHVTDFFLKNVLECFQGYASTAKSRVTSSNPRGQFYFMFKLRLFPDVSVYNRIQSFLFGKFYSFRLLIYRR